MMNDRVPKALFNSKAEFNPYQYLPFEKILEQNETEYVWNKKNLFITDEVGVGKTFEVGIVLAEVLRSNPELNVLIICPVKLCEEWCNQLEENFYIPFKNYYSEHSMGQRTVLPYSYFSNKELKNIEEADQEEENLQEQEEMSEHMEELPSYDILILDEAHYIRNRSSKLWNCINRMIEQNEPSKEKQKLKVFMTGTSICNSEYDYETVTTLLLKNGQSFESTQTLQGEANCYDEILKIFLWGKGTSGAEDYDRNRWIEPSETEKKIIAEIYTTIEPDDEDEDEEDEFCDDESEGKRVRQKYGVLTGYLKRIAE